MRCEKIKLDVSFYAMSLLAILCGYYTEWVIYLISIVIHECGHLLMAFLFRWRLKDIRLFGFGGIMTFEGELNKSNFEDLMVSFGGILANLIFLGCLVIIPGKFLDIKLLRLQGFFIHAQIFIIAFNLIPLPPLDGNRILMSCLAKFFPYRYVLKVSKWVTISLLVALIGLTLSYDFRQYTVVLSYLAVSTIRFNKQMPYLYQRFILQKNSYKNTGLSTKKTILNNYSWESFLYKGYNNSFIIHNKHYNEEQLLSLKYTDNFLSFIDDKRKN